MLRGSDGLESHERNLHGADEAEDEESCVGRVDPGAAAPHEDQHQHMQGNEVDDVDVAAPSADHVEVGEGAKTAPKQAACLY